MLTPIEFLKEVQIGLFHHQITKLGTSLSKSKEEDLITLLKKNIDLFAYAPSDMPNIDTIVACHCLVTYPSLEPMSQRKCKVGEENRVAIDKEVYKLIKVSFITKVKCLLWPANVGFVRKTSNKWCMFIDFIDLGVACPKYLYPLPNIGYMIDKSSSYKTLSFTDAYSGYNQIKMDHIDAPKTTFMSNHRNYYHNSCLLGLRTLVQPIRGSWTQCSQRK